MIFINLFIPFEISILIEILYALCIILALHRVLVDDPICMKQQSDKYVIKMSVE